VGTYAKDAATAKRWIDAGVQYMSVGPDVGIFADACSALIASIRG
jgi:4-hydroxy-2-oxoheptanedioate aldolase